MVLFPAKLNKQSQELNSCLWIFMFLAVIFFARFIFKGLLIGLYSTEMGFLSIFYSLLTLLAICLTLTQKHKSAVYFFYFMHVVQCLTYSVLSPETAGQSLVMSVCGCIIFSLFLCLKKNGKSAWSVIFSQPYVEGELG